jgi:hypothetical protein
MIEGPLDIRNAERFGRFSFSLVMLSMPSALWQAAPGTPFAMPWLAEPRARRRRAVGQPKLVQDAISFDSALSAHTRPFGRGAGQRIFEGG